VPGVESGSGAAQSQRRTVDGNATRGRAAQARERLEQFGPATADQAGKANDLASSHGE